MSCLNFILSFEFLNYEYNDMNLNESLTTQYGEVQIITLMGHSCYHQLDNLYALYSVIIFSKLHLN